MPSCPRGVYVEVDTGNVGIGVWEATGPDTVAMTFTETNEEGSYTVRASITVDGDNLSADYTVSSTVRMLRAVSTVSAR